MTDQRIVLERDLYRACLELAKSDDPEPLLENTLRLLREFVGATHGYIELTDTTTERDRQWCSDAGVGPDERAVIRGRVSRGIVAAAVEHDEVVHTHSALLDERFSSRASVRENRIEEVLCVPLRSAGVVGVVYLQNASGAPPFGPDAIACARRVAGFAASVAGRLLEVIRHRDGSDPTAEVRAKLGADLVIGRSPALARFLERLAVVAPMESNTLLTGPSGSGKSMFARLIHDNSRRASGPFVELNCAALPENLIESELFGAERGAHSGVAHKGALGKVDAAAGGTLFLDEVGELGRNVQAKLLHLLESKEFYRLGGTKTRQANVRIVAATNVDLRDAIRGGAFREDLYYRLAGVELAVPPLADRREDIPLLAAHLCTAICEEERLPPMTISPSTLAALEFADWPGNVRELINCCKSAVVNARMDGTDVIEIRHVFPQRGDEPEVAAVQTFQEARAAFERTFLCAALTQREWNVAQTARELDISRSHLNALIRRYQLQR